MNIEGEFHDRKTTPECSEDRHDSSAECGEDRKWTLCMHTTSVQAPHTHIWRTAKLSDKTHTYWIHLHLRANKTARSMSSLKTSSCIRYLIPSSPPLLRCVSTTISPLVLKFFLSHPLYRTTERIVGAWGKYKKWGPYYRLCEAGSGGTLPWNFAILHALKCVLGASEAPFWAYTQYIPASFCLRLAVSDRKVRHTGPLSVAVQ